MKSLRFRDVEAVSPVIAIILMVAITVVLASVLYVWVMNLSDADEEAAEFPTIRVALYKNSDDNTRYLKISHDSGDPIFWEEYKIIIINISNEQDRLSVMGIKHELKFGESVYFTDNGSKAAGFKFLELVNGQ